MGNAIETDGLHYTLGRGFALEDVSLRVPVGSIYGFLGPNGAGKTTTIRLLMGFHRPTRGAIRILDRAIPRELPTVLSATGFVPERPHLYPTLTVAETVRHHSAFQPRWDREWAASLFRRFALAEDRRVSRLSKGEMGKLLLLLALGQRPDLLILDEPTEGLDPVVRRELMSVLMDYVADRTATVFISSHLVHELERFCDWVGIMDRGRLLTEMPMTQFKNSLKRLRLSTGVALPDAPFELLVRERAVAKAGETWLVRGWESSMTAYIAERGAEVREVIDLDLEEGFVELLRSFRVAEQDASSKET